MFENPSLSRTIPVNSTLTMSAACLACAVIVGLSALVRIHVPGTPVPITLQTFALLTCSGLLRKRYALEMTTFYILLGVLGAPFFSGGSGFAYMLGPTGGYIVGFIAASAIVGYLGEKKNDHLSRLGIYILATMAIYLPGLVHLNFTLGLDWTRTLQIGFFPFIAFDIVKAVAACGVSSTIGTRLLR